MKHFESNDIHRGGFVQAIDPATVPALSAQVRAGVLWIDTTATPALLLYRNAANNEWLPVGAGDGGGGSGGEVSPDTPPANPDPADDEFNEPTLNPRWTEYTQGISDLSFENGNIVFNVTGLVDSPFTNGRKAIMQNLPASGNWTYRCKMATPLNKFSSSFGMKLRETSSTQSAGLTIIQASQNQLNTKIFGDASNSYPDQGSAQINDTEAFFSGAGFFYFEISKVGTDLIYKISSDGKVYFEVFRTLLNSQFVAAPDQIGFHIDAAATRSAVACDWFRRIA